MKGFKNILALFLLLGWVGGCTIGAGIANSNGFDFTSFGIACFWILVLLGHI